jgi:hypothetical protein
MSHFGILPDSVDRMIYSPEHQARLIELRREIEARYDLELQSAGYFQRIRIRRKIEIDFNLARQTIEPSDLAL